MPCCSALLVAGLQRREKKLLRLSVKPAVVVPICGVVGDGPAWSAPATAKAARTTVTIRQRCQAGIGGADGAVAFRWRAAEPRAGPEVGTRRGVEMGVERFERSLKPMKDETRAINARSGARRDGLF